MNSSVNVRKRRVERSKINNRVKLLSGVFFIGLVAVSARVYHIQFNDYEKQFSIAKSNTIKELYLSPERGRILDRNGVVLADTRPYYDLVVFPERIANYRKDKKDAIWDFLEVLEQFINIDDKEGVHEKIFKSDGYNSVIIKRDLDSNSLSTMISNLVFLDGIGIESKKVRNYPFGENYLSPIGYVGRVSKEDLRDGREYKIINSDYVGKSSIEALYDKELYGQVGVEKVAVNARGRVIERKITKVPQKGSDVILTIDSRLQNKAIELMKGKKGAVIITDVKNGDLLSLVSAPFFDPNKFISGMSKEESKNILSKDMPLFNRALRGQYPPASTIKPFMALAGLEGEFIKPDKVVWSGPYFEIGGHRFRDWKRWGHGKVNLRQAMEVSSDVYFYRLGDTMGIDYIHDFFSEFGFGKKPMLGVSPEAEGIMPSSSWKTKVKGEPWYGGETINVSIGQGYFMSTPMQLNNAYMMLLNDGVMHKPRIVMSEEPEIINKVSFSKENINSVKKGLEDVVHGEKGTARSLRYKSEMMIAGKTGTGQVFSTKGHIDYDNEKVEESLRDHALFSGYAPMNSPEVLITVVIENGSSGSSVAAPIAKSLFNEYSKNKKEDND